MAGRLFQMTFMPNRRGRPYAPLPTDSSDEFEHETPTLNSAVPRLTNSSNLDEDEVCFATCYMAAIDVFRDVLSLVMLIVGAVCLASQNQYLGIVDNKIHFTRELILCTSLGGIALILSITKTVASCCSLNSEARKFCNCFGIVITTLLFGMTVFNVAVSVITVGKYTALEDAYFESATRTFLDLNNTQTQWDHFQSTFECCGVSGPIDYVKILNDLEPFADTMPDFFTNIVSESYTNIVPENWINTVPESCCNLPLLRSQGDNCSDIVAIMSTDDIVANRIYNQGCVEAVVSKVTFNYIVAGTAASAFFCSPGGKLALWLYCFTLPLSSAKKKDLKQNILARELP